MEMTIFTLEQLKQFDGKAGKPAYIAINRKIYDVSSSGLWMEGDHQWMHSTGNNLTGDIANAPHGEEVFNGFPVIGVLRKQGSASIDSNN
jgi:predicted heme/steroid binding protein